MKTAPDGRKFFHIKKKLELSYKFITKFEIFYKEKSKIRSIKNFHRSCSIKKTFPIFLKLFEKYVVFQKIAIYVRIILRNLCSCVPNRSFINPQPRNKPSFWWSSNFEERRFHIVREIVILVLIRNFNGLLMKITIIDQKCNNYWNNHWKRAD